MMPFGQKLATRGAESSLAVRLFIVAIRIETDEKCSRRPDAGIARSYGTRRFMTDAGVGQSPTLGVGDVEKGSLRLTREDDRPDVSGSDTSG